MTIHSTKTKFLTFFMPIDNKLNHILSYSSIKTKVHGLKSIHQISEHEILSDARPIAKVKSLTGYEEKTCIELGGPIFCQ